MVSPSQRPPLRITYNFHQHGEEQEAVLVVPVNCLGVMGKGFALAVKKEYPKMAKRYHCLDELEVGNAYFDYSYENFGGPFQGVCFATTKGHWRNHSKYEWIELIALDFFNELRANPEIFLYIPQLGCGEGDLDWSRVHTILESWLEPYEGRYAYLT